MSDLPALLISSVPLSVGAMVGAVGRAMTESLVAGPHARLSAKGWWPGSWPLATFLVNVGGSLLLGLVTGFAAHLADGGGSAALVTGLVGFTGGFSTFSTALVDATKPAVAVRYGHNRTKSGAHREFRLLLSALLHAFAMVGVCLAAAALGMSIGAAV